MIYDHEPFMDEAACKRHWPDMWFSGDPQMVSRAKQICRTECKVQEACLEWAVRTRHKHGIAGGLTPEERKVPRG